MTFDVYTVAETPTCTASRVICAGEFVCFLIEDGDKQFKVKKQTRIPAGKYEVVPYRAGRIFSKYKELYNLDFVPLLKDVPNFTGIILHIRAWPSCAYTQ